MGGERCGVTGLSACVRSPIAQMRTVPSHDAVAYSSLCGSTAKPYTMSVCDRTSVTCFCVGTSKTPIVPVAVPTNSLRPSREASTDVTGPSCSASST